MGAVDLTPCDGGQVGQAIGIADFMCGEHEVFESRQVQSGRRIPLKITVVPAKDRDSARRQAPVFALAGGPGQAAHDLIAGAYVSLQPGMATRDLVLVDIRGTGGSNPLHCEPLGPKERIQSWIYYILPFEEAAQCVETLSERADLTQYTTTYAADDLNEVREALGYETFALWAGSYGTLLGQEIIRRHGEYVDAAVFIGIAPPSMHAPMGFARSLETTRDRLVADCARNDDCSAAYPDFEDDLEAVLARARERPVSAEVVSPITREREEVVLEYGDFVMGVRFVLYNAAAAGSLPSWITRARNDDFEPLMQAITDAVYGIRQILHYGLFLSMRCAEDLPYVDIEAERADAAGTMLGTYRMDRERENCTVWPRAELTSDRHSPVESDVPVLLLSGSEDPVTPPAYGDKVAETLPNSLHVVFANRGHGFFDREALACLHGIVEPFLMRSSVEGLDPSCAATIERLPFSLASGAPGDQGTNTPG